MAYSPYSRSTCRICALRCRISGVIGSGRGVVFRAGGSIFVRLCVSCVCIKLRFLGQQSEKAATDSAVGFFRLKRTGSRCHSSDPPLLPGGFRACGTWWQCGRYAVSVGRPSPAARIAKTLRGVTHFHAPTSGHLSQKRRWQRAGRFRLGMLPVFCRLALAFVGGEGIGDCGPGLIPASKANGLQDQPARLSSFYRVSFHAAAVTKLFKYPCAPCLFAGIEPAPTLWFALAFQPLP